MGTVAKPTRENRTITVAFRDEATYFHLITDGKALVECVLAFVLAIGFQLTLNFSHFVAHKIWRGRGISPLRGGAHRLQRRKPLRCLLVSMDTIFDLLQTAIN